MEDRLINLTTAILLKEKGFNIKCRFFYTELNGLEEFNNYTGNYSLKDTFYDKKNNSVYYESPTQSLVQKWLREKHKLFICVKHKITGDLENPIVEFTYNGNNGEWNNKYYDSYEEALENALIECLSRI